jgi:hypothetical protein
LRRRTAAFCVARAVARGNLVILARTYLKIVSCCRSAIKAE